MSIDPLPDQWWRDRIAIVELLDDLIDRAEVTTAAHARDVVESPWKWSNEMRRLLRDRAAEERVA